MAEKTLKIASISLWDNQGISNMMSSVLKRIGYDIAIVNPFETEADIVFYHWYNTENCSQCIGNPTFIFLSGENENRQYGNRNLFNSLTNGNYSITFYDDTEDNLYFPLWKIQTCNLSKRETQKIEEKNKFCTFIVSNDNLLETIRPDWCFEKIYCRRRIEIFDYITKNYKRIDSVGGYKNNMNGWTLPRELESAIDFHRRYKFNLCCENSDSEKNSNYITEKLINAYVYGVVPIYWGSERVCEWFNPKSFINCNGKTNKEILEEIEYIDNNDKAYEEMLNAYPFYEKIDYHKETMDNLSLFLEKIIQKREKEKKSCVKSTKKMVKTTVLIINNNEKEKVYTTILSINKITPNTKIYIFDNSDNGNVFDNSEFEDVTVFDNTKKQYFETEGLDKKMIENKAIDLCFNLIPEENFLFIEAGIITNHHLSLITLEEYVFIGGISNNEVNRRCVFINKKMCLDNGIKFSELYTICLKNNLPYHIIDTNKFVS